MVLQAIRRWLPRSIRPVKQKLPGRRPRARLTLEGLEDRIVPSFVDLGPLRFSGDFTRAGTQYTANGGTVDLGLKPTHGAGLLRLLDFDLKAQKTPGVLRFDTTDTTNFQFTRAAVESVVQGPPLPIWQTSPTDTDLTKWSVDQLVSSNGLSVSGGQPFTARGVSFTLADLVLATPDGNTDHAQVKMQGSVTFPQLAKLDLSRVHADVDGYNYLITDTSGIHLTGLTVSLSGSPSFNVFGMTATLVTPSVTYSNADGQDSFKFSIGATLQTKQQDNTQQRALENVGADLSLTLTGDKLTQLGFDLQGSFKIFGLAVATDTGNPLTFDFNFADQQYEIRGGLTVTVPTATASSVDVILGYASDPGFPGIVIQDGILTQLNAEIIGSLSLASLQLTTPDGLNFSYDRAQDQFEMYGDLQLQVPTAGGKTTSITAQLGTYGAPGLVIQYGQLQQLNMSLSGQFDLFGLTIQVTSAGVMYDRAQDLYEISGTISAPQLWKATVQLGMTGNPGIEIQDGHFHLDNVTIGLSEVNLGVFTIQKLQVAYSRSSLQADFTLAVTVDLVFPGGWDVGGSVTFVNGKLNDIELHYSALNSQSIAIADTGLYLTYLEGSVQNIDDPHNLIVSGNIALTYGSSITITNPLDSKDYTVSLFAAEGGFTVDRNELKLGGNLYLGAYTNGTGNNDEPIYTSLLGEDDSASVDLDWGARRYSATASLSLYGGVIQVQGAFAFDLTGDIVLAAKASLVVPSEIPIIGGDTLGSVDFLFEYHEHALDSSFFAAWTEFTIPIIDKDVKFGIKYDIRHSHLSVLSGSAIDAFDGCFNDPVMCLNQNGYYSYYSSFTAPAGATGATLSVSWPQASGTQYVVVTLPSGTQVKQSDFNPTTNGIALVPQFGSATATAVHATSSGTDVPLAPGNYTLTLYSTQQFDMNSVKFGSVFHYPAPTLAPVNLGAIPTDGSSLVPVTLTGTVDEAFKAKTLVSLYVDVNNDPTHRYGTPVKGATALPITTDGQGHWSLTPNWDLTGLLPVTNYYLYALINDGTNAQVTSDYSLGALPVPPLDGQVTDVAPGHGNKAVSGMLVYLDLNHNGRYDPPQHDQNGHLTRAGEPTSITNADGFYEFWGDVVQANTPYDVAAVVPQGFQLYTQDPLNTNPRTGVVYDGQDPVAINFALIKLPSISGTVFNDFQQNGHLSPGDAGLGNWLLHLTGSGGETTATTRADGTYSFLGLTPGTYTLSVDVPQKTYYLTAPVPVPFHTVTIVPTSGNPDPQITGQDFGTLAYSTVSGNVSQHVLQNGTLSPSTTPVQGQTVYLLAARGAVAIDTGSLNQGYGNYVADQGYSGASSAGGLDHSVTTDEVVNPAPADVYKTNRYGPDFSYAVPGLTPGGLYTVRLHFAETFWDDPGDRIFDVAINGQAALTRFDIFAAAQADSNSVNGKFIAITRSFTVAADANGTITIHFTSQNPGDTDNAQVNGIEVTPQQAGTLSIDAGGPAAGAYVADQYASGGQAGQPDTNPHKYNTSYVTDPAPEEVYRTNRVAVNGQDFSYVVPGLAPGGLYTVRLHFAETFWDGPGYRVFDVAINGQAVLTRFDIFAAAQAAGDHVHGKFIAVARSFDATADANGTITILFLSRNPGHRDNAQVNGIEITSRQASTLSINVGGGADGGYRADTGASGGQTANNSSPIDTSLVANPAPQDVYQTFRHGVFFTYAVTGLTPGATYLLRLHFVEPSFNQPGQRLMAVQINGQVVLQAFDIFGAAGARNRAVVEKFDATADASGRITLAFIGGENEALVNAIEVSQVIATTTTDAAGNYGFGGLRAGTYTVAQVVPPGSRQVAPLRSDVQLQTPSGGDVLPVRGSTPRPTSVVVADFDGDGKPDFAVLDSANDQYQVWIYYNGNYDFPVGYHVNTYAPVGLAAADFGATGRQSLAVVGLFGEIDVLRNDGGRSFQLVPFWFDSVFQYPTTVYGVVPGRFVPGGTDHGAQLAVLYAPQSGNGRLTVSVAYRFNGENTITTLYQSLFGYASATMAVGDVNRDGWDDLLVGVQGQTPVLVYGYGGTYQNGQSVSALSAAQTVVIGDINGDGVPDLGAFDANGVFSYAIQQGGTFTGTTTTIAPPITTVNAALFADVNGDLKPDLVWVSGGNGPLALFVATNTGTTGAWFTRAQQTVWSLAPGARGGLALALGDLDGDGLPDPVVLDTAARNIEIVHNRTVAVAPALLVSVNGSSSTGNNFVNAQLGQINGRIFDDVTRDGTNLLGKPARAGVTVYVDLNGNGRLDPGEPSLVTGPDGYYAISGLPAGHYQVRYVDDATRRPTTAEGGVYTVDLSVPGRTYTGLDFGNAVSIDRVLTIPAGTGTADWTVAVNRGRLEVSDGMMGVVDSEPLTDLHSLTVLGAGGRPTRFTIDLTAGGFFRLPGDVTFRGSPGTDNTLRLTAGPGDDAVAVRGPQATINAGLSVSWVTVTSVVIDAGNGNNRLNATGTLLARGVIDLVGGTGNDTYGIATRNSAMRVTDSGGADTLDFSGATAGVGVSLGLDHGQTQAIGGGNNTLAIRGTIENLTGTPYADVLTGNGADNVIRGLAGNNVLIAGPGTSPARRVIDLVGGTGNDTYVIAPQNSAVSVTDSGGMDTLDFSAATAGVNVNLALDRGQTQPFGGGNNRLTIRGTIENLIGTPYADVLTGNNADDVIRGLAGSDVLTAGGGNSILDGGPGNDVLIAGPGRDVLIGGTGNDVLFGYGLTAGRPPSAGSLLIGGSTAYDANDQALRALLAEWSSSRSYAQRVANLRNGSGSNGRLNGSYFLNAQTVRAGDADAYFGDSRVDWLLTFPGDWVIDLSPRGRRPQGP